MDPHKDPREVEVAVAVRVASLARAAVNEAVPEVAVNEAVPAVSSAVAAVIAVAVTVAEVAKVDSSAGVAVTGVAAGVAITPVVVEMGGVVVIPAMLPRNRPDPSFHPEATLVRVLAKPAEEIVTTGTRTPRNN